MNPAPLNVITFIGLINQLREEFAISCTCWFRTAARNKRVGGLVNSKHLKGLAVDIVRDKGTDKEALLKRIREMGLEYEDEPDHIHIEAP